MEHKPWSLLILAFFHFIEPISKVLFYSIYFHVSPIDVITIEYNNGSILHSIEYFFLFPIAGIAIFAVKKWSLPVFLGVELWALISNVPYLESLYQSNQILLLTYFILFALLNVSVVSYLLIPAVRLAYLEPHVRWWEAKPRYAITLDAWADDESIGSIKNISESGVFLATDMELPINTIIELKFSPPTNQSDTPNHFSITQTSTIVHRLTIDNIEGYGIRYNSLSTINKRAIHSLIRTLEKSGSARRPPRREIYDMMNWIQMVIKTGKGLIPTNQKRSYRRNVQ